LIYSLGKDPRGRRAEQLLAEGGVISVQILNEFSDVARRKIRMSWDDVKQALQVIHIFCPDPLPITLDTHQEALAITEKYGYRIYDALIVTSALEAKCTILFSEDMQDGQLIANRLKIRNPFK
jgi:predicted nucleic acid-binding protein